MTVATLKRHKIAGLYGITAAMTDTAALLKKTRQILDGGARLIQYRNKSADRTLQRLQAKALLQICRDYHVPLLINDHVELALEVNADGVHLGAKDTDIVTARAQLGMDKIIGASCYNRLTSAVQATKSGADYVAFGAFYPTLTKHDTVTASIDILLRAKNTLDIPVVCIGGINSANALTLIKNGADAVAVCQAIYQTNDASKTAAAISRFFH